MGMFIKPILYFAVRKFVIHRAPQQIFMDVNTEYRANLVKLNLLHIYLICQYKLFFKYFFNIKTFAGISFE